VLGGGAPSMRKSILQIRLRSLVIAVLASGVVFGGSALGRQSGFFKEMAIYYSGLEDEAKWPPIDGLALMSNGVCQPSFKAESQNEKTARLGRLANHARMRRFFAWLDQIP
jgi:hypothetical protein